MAAANEQTALGVAVTGGQAHDAPAFQSALCDMPDETAASTVVADRAYDSDVIRADMEAAGVQVVIPPRRNRKDPTEYDREAYKEREKVERMTNRLKSMRRLATRYEKLGRVFLAMMHIACLVSILL